MAVSEKQLVDQLISLDVTVKHLQRRVVSVGHERSKIIKALRAKGWSLQEIADVIGVTRGAIHQACR